LRHVHLRKDDTQVDSNTVWIGEREGITIIPDYLVGHGTYGGHERWLFSGLSSQKFRGFLPK
jgi:hypothetical protein